MQYSFNGKMLIRRIHKVQQYKKTCKLRLKHSTRAVNHMHKMTQIM